MYLSNFEPFRELKELERRLADFLETRGEGGGNISSFSPSLNTREDEKSYYIELDLPGVKKEDISIDINKNSIKVSAERKTKEKIKKEDYYKLESFFGKFQRSFVLPDNVNPDDIKASFEHGVLEMVLPKSDAEKSRKIEIS